MVNYKKSILICIDSIYACFPTLFLEIYEISKKFSVGVLFVNDTGRGKFLTNLEEFKSKGLIENIYCITRKNDFKGMFINGIKVRKFILKKYDVILLGSSINFEELLVLSNLRDNQRIIGVLVTIPPGIAKKKAYTNPSGFIKENIRSIRRLFYKTIEKVFRRIIFGVKFSSDAICIETDYLSKGVAKVHICYDELGSYYLSRTYNNEPVYFIENPKESKNISVNKEFKNINILLIGPARIYCKEIILKIIDSLNNNFGINFIAVRSHPRFEINSNLIVSILETKGIKCGKVDNTVEFSSQIDEFDIAIGYNSSLFSGVNNSQCIVAISEEWSLLESGNIPIEYQIGSFFGFNKSWSVIDKNLNIISLLSSRKVENSVKKVYSIIPILEKYSSNDNPVGNNL